jgi:hypothetical protein
MCIWHNDLQHMFRCLRKVLHVVEKRSIAVCVCNEGHYQQKHFRTKSGKHWLSDVNNSSTSVVVLRQSRDYFVLLLSLLFLVEKWKINIELSLWHALKLVKIMLLVCLIWYVFSSSFCNYTKHRIKRLKEVSIFLAVWTKFRLSLFPMGSSVIDTWF